METLFVFDRPYYNEKTILKNIFKTYLKKPLDP